MHGSDGLSEIVRNVWARKPPAPSMTEKSECDSVSGSISANTTRDSRWQNARKYGQREHQKSLERGCNCLFTRVQANNAARDCGGLITVFGSDNETD